MSLVTANSSLWPAAAYEFDEAEFRIHDDVDRTKQVKFDASAVPSNTTVTLFMGSGDFDFDNPSFAAAQNIDVTDAEAFLVRKNNDSGDVFLVDTLNEEVEVAASSTFKALGPSTLTGTVTAEGGIDVTGGTVNLDVTTGTTLVVDSTQSSSSSTTGAVTIAGGLGVDQNVHIGGTLNVTGNSTLSGGITFGSNLNVDVMDEATAGLGCTIESVLLKDGDVVVSNGNFLATDTITQTTAATGVTISNTVKATATGTGLTVTNNATVGGTLGVTGTSTLGVVNVSGLASLDGGIDTDGAFTVANGTGNVSTSGTLGVTGTSTLGVINASGLASLDAGIDVDGAFTVADTTGNVSTSGTLGVTGTSTLGVINASGLASLDAGIDVDGAFTVANTTGNVSTSGTLGVTGTSTLAQIDASGTINADGAGTGLAVDNNATVGGTLTVTGATALNGGITVDSTAFTVADTSGNVATAGTLDVTGTSTVAQVDASGFVTVTATATANTLGTGVRIGNYDAGHILDTTISGNASGGLIRGPADGHMVVQLDANETTDSFVVVTNSADDGNPDTILLRAQNSGAVDIPGSLDVTGAATVGTTLGVTGAAALDGGITVDTTAFTVADTSGNVSTAGTLTASGAAALNGGITVDSTAFVVSDTSGNVSTAGTLTASGAAALNGGITVDSTAFVVSDTSGNVSTAGTLTASGAAALNGGITVDSTAFVVSDTSGNVSTAGTLDVSGTSTLSVINASGLASLDAGIDVDGAFTVADTTGNVSTSGTLGVTGTSTLAQIDASGTINADGAGTGLAVDNNATVGGTLTVTGAAALNAGITVDSTAFTVADTTGNVSTAGTLSVTGTSTLAQIDASGTINADGAGTGLAVDNNATVGGTLGVTGTSTMARIDASGFITTTAATTANTLGSGVRIGSYSAGHALDTLISGSAFGGLIRGPQSGHVVVQLDANDADDSFVVATNSIDTGAPDQIALRVNRAGDLSILGSFTTEDATIIDVTSTEALLVRQNSDANDVFIVDTSNQDVEVASGSTLTVVDGLASLDGGIDVDGAFTVANSTGNVSTSGTMGVTGTSTLGVINASGKHTLTTNNTQAFLVEQAGGTNVFTVDTTNQDVEVLAGATFTVVDGLASLDGGIDVDGAFTVANTTGNVSTSGTLGVTGTSTLGVINASGLASLDAGIDVDGAFTVANTTGNVSTSGTLGVTGTSTLGVINASGLASLDAGIDVDGAFTVADTTGDVVTSGTLTVSGGVSTLGPSADSGSADQTGISVSVPAITYTDSATAASGTATSESFNYIATPTLAATNASVTTTTASTLEIAGAPTAGTNQTITNAYALNVAAGDTNLAGSVTVGTGVDISAGTLNMDATSGTTLVSDSTTDATNSTSGAATFAGGVGIAKKLFVGTALDVSTTSALDGLVTAGAGVDVTGTVNLDTTTGTTLVSDSTTDATNSTSGAATFAGGVGIAKKLFVGTALDVSTTSALDGLVTAGAGVDVTGTVNLDTTTGTTLVSDSTTDATNSTSGAATFAGGVGIAKKLFVGTALDVSTTSALDGLVTAGAGVDVTGTVNLDTTTGTTLVSDSTTVSTNSTSGAATFAGGVGIAKQLFVGDTLGVTGATTASGGIVVPVSQTITVDTINETTSASGVTIEGVQLKDSDVLIPSGSFLATNTISEQTAASGVTVDSVLLKDGGITTTGAAALNGGITVDSTAFVVADTSGNVSTTGTLGVTGTSTLAAVNSSDFVTVTGSSTTNTRGAGVRIGTYANGHALTSLVGGTTSGGLIRGPQSGHLVVQIDGNPDTDGNDSFVVVANSTDAADPDTVLFRARNTGAVEIPGTLAVTGATTNENSLTVDVTATEALLVRQDGDANDVFIVDTTNQDVEVASGATLTVTDGATTLAGTVLTGTAADSTSAFIVRSAGHGDTFSVDTSNGRITQTHYSSTTGVLNRFYSNTGTSGTPAASINNDVLWRNLVHGYDNAGFEQGGDIIMNATETWDATSHGTAIQFRTKTNGTTSLAARLVIAGDGDVVVNTGNLDVTSGALNIDATSGTTLVSDSTTDATNSTSGAATFAGGVGVAKKLYVGTDIDAGGTINSTGLASLDGGIDVNGSVFTVDSSGLVSTSSYITASGSVGANSLGDNVWIGKYGSAHPIATNTLTGGSTTGGLIRGPSNQHLVIQIDRNDTGDSFAVVTNSVDDADPDTLLFQAKASGAVSIPGTLAVTGTTTNQGKTITDITDTEALLVRQNGDAADVFIVDTTNQDVEVASGSTLTVVDGLASLDGGINVNDVFTVGTTGATLVKLDNATAFEVQKADATPAFTVDTTNDGVTFGTGIPVTITDALSVTGNASAGTLSVGVATPDANRAMHCISATPFLKLEDSGASADIELSAGMTMAVASGVEKGFVGYTSTGNTDLDIVNSLGDIGFEVNGTFAAGNRVMTIEAANERVGIGTATPASLLEVSGGLITAGAGVDITGTLNLDTTTGTTFVSDSTTDATNSTSGAATFAGGVGIAKKLYVGTDADVGGTLTVDTINETTSGAGVTIDSVLLKDGGVGGAGFTLPPTSLTDPTTYVATLSSSPAFSITNPSTESIPEINISGDYPTGFYTDDTKGIKILATGYYDISITITWTTTDSSGNLTCVLVTADDAAITSNLTTLDTETPAYNALTVTLATSSSTLIAAGKWVGVKITSPA